MKLALYFFLFIFSLILFDDKSLSLSDYQIKNICKKEKSKSNCIKDLQEKKYKLQKGDFIEIPVIPFKKQ